MIKQILLVFSVLVFCAIDAQITGFVAAKAVLSIREKPGAQSKVIGKIPYGEKITYSYDERTESINTDGFVGDWVKTTYKGTTGYVVSTYVLPFPPPKDGTKEMKDYLKQITQPFGQPLILKEKYKEVEVESSLTKQLYKNGMEYHETYGYEYYSATYFLPKFDVQKAYLLVRLIPEFVNLLSEKEPFYRSSTELKVDYGTKKIMVEKENYETSDWIKRVRIEREDGAFQFLEIFDLDGQIVIRVGAGV